MSLPRRDKDCHDVAMTFLLSTLPKPLIVLSTFTTNKVSLTMRGGWSGKGVAGVRDELFGQFFSQAATRAEWMLSKVHTEEIIR